MASLLRGGIYWADLDPTVGHEQAGRWPVLIVSRPAFNDRSGTVIALALTSSEPRAGFPLTLELTKTSLPKRTWVKISQIRTISTQRRSGRLASCHSSELEKVVEGLNELIGKP
jgi:mRNA interferase MazF